MSEYGEDDYGNRLTNAQRASREEMAAVIRNSNKAGWLRAFWNGYVDVFRHFKPKAFVVGNIIACFTLAAIYLLAITAIVVAIIGLPS